MNTPVLTAEENKKQQLILIIDKSGFIGEELARELSKDFYILFVSGIPIVNKNKKIAVIRFKGSIPKIPNNLYSKIFIIDDGANFNKNLLDSFIEKAKSLNAELYYLGSIRNINFDKSDEVIKQYSKIKILIFGDIFDDKVLFDRNSSINRFISESRINKKLIIRGDGLNHNYPINFQDTIKLIIKSIYINIPQRIVLLFSQNPITDISLANIFKALDPDIDVDFIKSQNKQNLYFPKNSQFALSKYDIKKKLNELNLELEDIENNYNKKNINKKIEIFKPLFLFLMSCIFILLLPFLSTFTYTFLGYKQIDKAKNFAEKGEFKSALNKVNNAKTFFKIAEQTSGPLEFEAKLINKENIIEPFLNKINNGKNLTDASTNLLNGVIKIKNAKTLIEFNESLNYFKNANLILQELKATNEIPIEISDELKNISPLVDVISNSSDVLGNVLGFDKTKTYLILFQNNSSLRPSGGEIESVGILKIKNGKIISFKIVSSKSLDDNLKNFVSPPFPLRRNLKVNNFYLKDSGQNSDFVKSAIDASDIYKNETGEFVDGVIAVNTNFLKNILDANKLSASSSSKQKINYQKIFENKLNSYSIDNEKIINQIYKEIISNQLTYINLSEVIGRAISEKDIMFAFKDQDIQNVFTLNKLSNNIAENRILEENSINDFFGISETNLSNNKVNYYISRSISRNILIDDKNNLNSSVKISFKNNSIDNNILGNYKCYLQLILPQGSNLNEISILGKKVNLIPAITDPTVYEKNSFVAPIDLEIEKLNESGKSIFGFVIIVPPGSSRNVLVNYSLPYKLTDLDKSTNYSVYVYKQPGVESFPFEQKFNLPNNYNVLPAKDISYEIKKDEEFKYLIVNNN